MIEKSSFPSFQQCGKHPPANEKNKIEIVSLPFCPEPTSHQLVKYFYNDRYTIVNKVLKMFKISKIINRDKSIKPDVPGDWFKGPF
jgi:hypothetical protein